LLLRVKDLPSRNKLRELVLRITKGAEYPHLCGVRLRRPRKLPVLSSFKKAVTRAYKRLGQSLTVSYPRDV